MKEKSTSIFIINERKSASIFINKDININIINIFAINRHI